MSDDKTLKIKIVTETEGDGADRAAAAIGKTGEKAEVSHLAMRKLAHAIGSEIPGGAALMESAFEGAENKMMGASFLLLAGVEMLRGAMEKLNKEKEQSKKISEAMADADSAVTKVVDAQREALEKADVAQAEFFHNYLRNAHDAVSAEAQLYEARMKASFDRANNADSTRRGIADKAIDDMEQRGVLSHAAAIKAKEILDLEYEARKLQRQKAQDIAEEGELARQRTNKEIKLGTDTNAEAQAEARYEAATQAKAKNDQRIKEAEELIAAGTDAKKALRDTGVTDDNVQQLRDFVAQYGGDTSASLGDQFHFAAMKNLGAGAGSIEANRIVKLFGSEGDRNLELYTGANIDIAAGKKERAMAIAKAAGLDISEGNAKSDVDFARQRMEKDRDAAQDLADKQAVMSASNRIKEAGDAANFHMKAAAEMLEGHAQSLGSFMQQVDRLTGAMRNMSPAQVADLARKVEVLESQIQGGRMNFAG